MRSAFVDLSIRQLTELDISSATALSVAAGWNQTAADWELLLRLHPEGCLGIECDGKIVATTTLICYQDQLAWLGMVLTHSEYSGRGFARRLVEQALRIAEAKKVRSVKLDATDQGRPLYESLGFRKEQSVERWLADSGSFAGIDPIPSGAMPDFEMDREAFGVDRSKVLKEMAAAACVFVAADGFAMLRTGARASYIGPCVARSPESAKTLLELCLGVRGEQCYWDLFPSNRGAVNIAEELNFTVQRRLVRMVKGADVRGDESMIYAGAGFELG